MAPGERIVIDLDPGQRDRLLRVLAHRRARAADEETRKDGRLRITAERLP
jgi:DNA primase